MADPIVLIDDDEDDEMIFREIVTKLGFSELKYFRDGEEALHYLITTSDSPFIIFCDINMPRMSGLQIRQKIQEDPFLREKSIPFVFISTATSPEQIIDAYQMSVQGFFHKGSNLRQMEEMLSLILAYWAKCKHPNSAKGR